MSEFANLRDTLAKLFDEPEDARRIAEDSGLNIQIIDFSGNPKNLWRNVLTQAEKETKTYDLMLVTWKEYQENKELINAWRSFLGTGRLGHQQKLDRQLQELGVPNPSSAEHSRNYSVWLIAAVIVVFTSIGIIAGFLIFRPNSGLQSVATPTVAPTQMETLNETASTPTIVPTYTPVPTATTPESLPSATALTISSTEMQPTLTPTQASKPTKVLSIPTSTYTPQPTSPIIGRQSVSRCQFIEVNMPQTQEEIAKKYGIASGRLTLFHEGCGDLITGFVANLGPEIEVQVPAGGCIDAPAEAIYTGDHIQNAYNNNDGRRAYTGSVIASVFSYRAWCDELHTPINSRVCIASENTELGVGWVSPPMFVPVTNGGTRKFSHCPPSTEIQYDAIAIDDTLVKVEQVCSDSSRDITSLFESFFAEGETLLHYKSAPIELRDDCRVDFTVQDTKEDNIGLMIKASSVAKPTPASSSRILNQVMVCDSNMEVLERNFQWKGPDTSICAISLDEGEFIVGTADRYGDRVNDPPEGTPCTAFAFVGPLEMQVAMNYGAGGDYHSQAIYEPSKYLMPKQVELDKHTECNKNRRDYEIIECRQNDCRTLADSLFVDVSPTPSLVCSFLDELVPKGEVEKILYGNNGVAGVQTRLSAAVDVPDGWKVHNHGRVSKGPISLEAGTYASFWAPSSCEPLVIPVAYAEQLCPFAVEQGVIDAWKTESADIPTVTSYINEFNSGRPTDEGGAFKAGITIPAGVIVATNFDENDDYSADKWSNYPVKPIVHYGSWGLFQTEGEYVAPNAGACRVVAP